MHSLMHPLMKKILTNFFTNKLYFLYLCVFSLSYSIFTTHSIPTDDLYLHLKVGEWMSTNLAIPHTAIYSWYGETVLPWVAHEWLSEVIFYKTLMPWILNEKFLVIGSLLMSVSFLFIIIKLNKQEIENHYISSFVYMLIITISFMCFFRFRPHVFSFLCFYLEMFCIYKFYNGKYNFIKVVPVITLLWVNLHGGSSSLSYFLLIGFIAFYYFPFQKLGLEHRLIKKEIPLKEIKKLLIVLIVSILMLFINPYGIEMVLYPYSNMNDVLMLSYINEWFPLDINSSIDKFMIFPVLIFCFVSLFTSKRKIDIVDLGYLIVFLFMTFKSVRFVMYFSLASSFIIFKYFSCRSVDELKKISLNINSVIKHNINITVFTFIFLLIFSFINNLNNNFLKSDDYLKETHLFETIKRENPQRIFSFQIIGNELMFSGIRPFIDGRADVYTKNLWKDAIDLVYLREDPEKIIEKYNFDYLVLEKKDNQKVILRWYLESNPQRYQLIEETDDILFFKVL